MTGRRRHRRVPISGTATLDFEDRGEIQSVQTMTGSISFGGVGLYSDEPIEIDRTVSITIDFISADGIIKTESLEGSVVYNKKIGEMFFMGVQFLEEVSPAGQPALHAHLKKVLSWDQS